MLGNERMKFH